jgi:trans-aconitate methyltransferase
MIGCGHETPIMRERWRLPSIYAIDNSSQPQAFAQNHSHCSFHRFSAAAVNLRLILRLFIASFLLRSYSC